jgi:hypothetical protein
MKTSRWLFRRVAAFSLVVFLSACANATPVPPTPTPTRELPPTETPGPTRTPQATPTTAPTPTPTPIVPAVAAVQQRIDESSLVTVSSVTFPEPGWLVILASGEDGPGDVIGYVSVPAGSSRDVTVEIDPYAATATLIARLHEDSGEPELFEYPEGDRPLAWNGEPVEAAFAVTLDLILPSVTVADQTIARSGQVVVESVSVPEAGWMALHADEDGEPGAILGQTPLAAGDHENGLITFDWHRATSPMHVLVYQDLGIEGRFEPDTVDAPYLSQGEPISATFMATLPLDVYVIDQPVAATGEVVIERVSVGQPAWVAVYTNFAGYSDRLIGFARVEAGATRMLVIPVETQNLTPILHVRVHADEGTAGEFENPGSDVPLDEDGRLTLYSFQIDAGSYVVTVDQPAGDEVDVPLVVADTAVWLVIVEQEDDAPDDLPGRVLGALWLPPGIHRDLVVPVDGAAAGTTLLAALHLDAGEEETFEYPDGPDVPMRQLRAYIRAPFALTP